MSTINNFTFTGNVATDMKVYNGRVDFSIAVSSMSKKEDGSFKANFYDCRCFKHTAEYVEKNLKKGMRATVSGRVDKDEYTNKDGVKVNKVVFIVNDIDCLQNRTKTDGAQTKISGGSDTEYMVIPDGLEEEIPFQ